MLSKCYSLALLELKSNTGDNNVALGAKRNHPKFVKDRQISSLSLKAPSFVLGRKADEKFSTVTFMDCTVSNSTGRPDITVLVDRTLKNNNKKTIQYIHKLSLIHI